MLDELRQTKILNELHCVKMRCLNDFDLERLLFNISQYAIESTLIKAFKDCIKRIICNTFVIKYSGFHFPLLLVSYDYKRNDHEKLWKNIKEIFDEYDEIIIENCGINNLLSLCSIFKSFKLFIKIFLAIRHIGNFKEHLYLAGRLTELTRMNNILCEWKINNSVALIFFDGGSYENLVVQHLKGIGLKTVTLQHGQPVFHGMNTDRINQTMILNFSSDYVLVTGEYSKKQFMLGGVREEAICVVGSCRKVKQYTDSNSNVFSVFLDCPTYEASAKDNRKMLNIAEKIAAKKGFKYRIKLHPQDNGDKYIDLKLEYGEFMSQMGGIAEALDRSRFAILHASGVYLDIISMGVKAYCMESEFDFPLVDIDDDKFTTLNELELKLRDWDNKSFYEKQEYMNKVIKYYLSPENSIERYRQFIESLIRREAVSLL